MARLPDLEPIQVSLEKEFQPFLGMKKLRPGETPDVIGRSRLFNLEGIGQGEIKLGDVWYHIDNIKGNFLSAPKNTTQLLPVMKYLQNSIADVVADIHSFLSNLTVQPNIRCIVRAGKIELTADNANVNENLLEGALFYSFTPLGRSKARDLLVPPKLPFLKDLFFRFEPK